MSDRDKKVAARIAAGDMAALELLYRRHVDRVWGYAWSRTRSPDAASDIVQETFLKVAEAAGQFEGRSALSTWLFAVTRSVTVAYIRRDRNHRRDPAILQLKQCHAHEQTNPAARNEATERANRVRDAVQTLPAAQRDALILYEWLGMGVKETADVLGWTEGRVKTTLFRARRKLYEKLRGEFGADFRAADAGPQSPRDR